MSRGCLSGQQTRGGLGAMDGGGGSSSALFGPTADGMVIVIDGVLDNRLFGANEIPYGSSDGTLTCSSVALAGAPTVFYVGISSNEGGAPWGGTIYITTKTGVMKYGAMTDAVMGMGPNDDPNTYVEFPAADTARVVVGGVNAITCTALASTFASRGIFPAGSAAAPGLKLGGTESGLYEVGGYLGVVASGVLELSLGFGVADFTNRVRVPNGTVAAPSIAASNNAGAGLFLEGGDVVSIVCGTQRVLRTSVVTGAPRMGFYGAAPVVQQNIAGSKGGNAALGNLLTALAVQGLITDSTT